MEAPVLRSDWTGTMLAENSPRPDLSGASCPELVALDAAKEAAQQEELGRLGQIYFGAGAANFPGVAVEVSANGHRDEVADAASVTNDLFPLTRPLLSCDGSPVDLTELVNSGPLVVLFFRGTWCTLCCLALRHLSQSLPVFRHLYGANFVAISGQLPPHNRACEDANALEFPVLCDKGLALAHDLNIVYSLTSQEARFYDFVAKPGFDSVYGKGHRFKLPLPATFVLEQRTGRIAYAFVDSDLTKRSRLLRIDTALQSLQNGRF